MKLEKNKINKNGYLLLESLLTLFVLLGVVLLLNPLLNLWFIQKRYEQNRVEERRVLYEESSNWKPNKGNSLKTKGIDRHGHLEIYEIKWE